MDSRVTESARAKDIVAELRSSFLPVIQNILRKIAEVQTKLHTYKKRIEIMKKVSNGHNEYFAYLRSIVELPVTYKAFLSEIVRRRQFAAAYDKSISELECKISAFRDCETSERANFKRIYGNDLPQMFVAVVPSIEQKPPFVTLSSTGMQWLPEVNESDLDAEDVKSLQQKNLHVSSLSLSEKKAREDSELDYSMRLKNLEEENVKLRAEIEMLRGQQEMSPNTTPQVDHSAHSPDDLALASAMSALSSVVDMVSKQGVCSLTLIPERGFLTSQQNLGTDSEFVVQMVRQFISCAERELKLLKDQVTAAEENVDAALSSSSSQIADPQPVATVSDPEIKISFLSFSIGDVAFFWKTTDDIYVAFNIHLPYRFLAPESIQAHKDYAATRPRGRGNTVLSQVFIGRIIEIRVLVAVDGNPYNIKSGTEYFVLTTDPIEF